MKSIKQHFVSLAGSTPIEWVGTALIIASAALTSQNIYPLNLWVASLGGVIWVWMGIVWEKNSLTTLNAILLAITVYGLIATPINSCN